MTETDIHSLALSAILRQHLANSIAALSLPMPDAIPLKLLRGDRITYGTAIALQLARPRSGNPNAIARQLARQISEVTALQAQFHIEVSPVGLLALHLTPVGIAIWLQRLIQSRPATLVPNALEGQARQAVDRDRLFEVQYAHARCCSLLRMATESGAIALLALDDLPLWYWHHPHPISWLDPTDALRFREPEEVRAIAQLVATAEGIYAMRSDRNSPQLEQETVALARSLLHMHRSCRLWGEVKQQDPELVLARLGLVAAIRRLLWVVLRSHWQQVAPVTL